MYIIVRLILVVLSFFSYSASVSSQEIIFMPVPSTKAILKIGNHSIFFDVIDPKTGVHRGSIDLNTEKQVHVVIDDYSFDNRKGFSIWSVDEGMGIYNIYRVFLYSKEKFTFVEVHPDCGDEFINLKIDKKGKRLISTYYEDNVPRLCITHLLRVDSIAP